MLTISDYILPTKLGMSRGITLATEDLKNTILGTVAVILCIPTYQITPACPPVSCVPGSSMATVIVGNYECWNRIAARDCTAHTSPIATISHGTELCQLSSIAFCTPSWAIQYPNA